MKRIFLDTSAYSEFKRGNDEVIDAVRIADEIHVNPVVIAELYAGFDGGKFKQQNRSELRKFLARDPVYIDAITEETAERYTIVYHALRKKGTPVPANDLWIAASVLETGTFLITADSDFGRLDMIGVHIVQTP